LKKRILFTCHLFYAAACFSQATPLENNTAVTARSYFKSSLSYLSNAVYQGRKDSSVISYITPAISYMHKSGFNFTGALSYSPNHGISQIELISIETGYDHQFSESLSVNGYAGAYFYNQFSTSVRSENNAGLGVGISYSPKDVFILSADAGLSVAKSPDIATELSIGHPLYFGSDGHSWSVVPAAAIVAGSQFYYQSYYTNRKFNQNILARQGRRRRANSAGNSNTTSVISDKGYKILDYELSTPVTYDEKKWGLFFTPIYSIPVHPFSYKEGSSTTPIVEKLTNSLYVTIGADIKF
jgi:hypothetical protein